MTSIFFIVAGVGGLICLYFFVIKKHPKQTPIPTPTQRILRMLTSPPGVMEVGDAFKLDYDVIELPSGKPAQGIVNWRVERLEGDPRAPGGGPDEQVIYILSKTTPELIAASPGTRKIIAYFSDTPNKNELAFTVKVVYQF